MKNKTIVSGVLSVSIALLATQNINAEDNTEGNNKDWDKPIFIKGADLEGQELQETKDDLKVKDDFETYSVNVNDVSKYVPSSGNLSYIYSSATIEKKSFRSGVDVEIDTPDNITKVTNEQYRNAAITAGIKNADIHIASVEPVTGEGALAGIYKAYEEKGNTLNSEDIENADKEMQDLSQISEDNKDQEGYSDGALNNAVAEIKQEIAKQKQNNNDLNESDVRNIVDDVLKEKGLNKVLSDNQVNTINNLMVNVAKSNAVNQDPKAFEKQAKNLSKDTQKLANKAKDKLKDLNTEENRNLLQRVWDAIVDFIKWLINLISSLF